MRDLSTVGDGCGGWLVRGSGTIAPRARTRACRMSGGDLARLPTLIWSATGSLTPATDSVDMTDAVACSWFVMPLTCPG